MDGHQLVGRLSLEMANQAINRTWHSSRKTRLRACFIVACTLLTVAYAMYLQALLTTPVRTPLIVLAGSYQPPWDINPWVHENVENLRRLDGRNLIVHDVGDVGLIASGVWDGFDAAVRSADRIQHGQPLLFYVNLHGAVDDSGQPCLIPPSAAIDDSRTWISLKMLLQRISQQISGDRTICLYLESGRLQPWPGPICTCREFADAVKATLEDVDQAIKRDVQPSEPNWVVHLQGVTVFLSSTGETPTSSDASGTGDVFSSSLARGLSGSADSGPHGNQDGVIQTDELCEFLTQQLRDWTIRHRGDIQCPCLVQAGNPALNLAWRLPTAPKLISELEIPDIEAQRQVTATWQQLVRLRKATVWERFPGHWSDLANRSVAFEQATFGGLAAKKMVARLKQSIAAEIGWLDQQFQQEVDVTGVNRLIAQKQGAAWSRLANQPTIATAQDIVQEIVKHGSAELAGVPVIHLLSNDPSNVVWQHSDVLSRYAGLRASVLAASANWGSIGGSPSESRWHQELSKINTNIADTMLAGQRVDQWISVLDRYEVGLGKLVTRNEFWSRQMALRNAVLAETPMIGTCLIQNARCNRDQLLLVTDQLEALGIAAAKVNQVLRNTSTVDSTSLEDDLPTLPNLAEMLDGIRQRLDQTWSQVAGELPGERPYAGQFLEQVLAYPWFPEDNSQLETLGQSRIAARLRLIEHDRTTESSKLDDKRADSAEIKTDAPTAPQFLLQWSHRMLMEDDRRLVAKELRELARQMADGQLADQPNSNDLTSQPTQATLFDRSTIARFLAGTSGAIDATHSIGLEHGFRKQQRLKEFAEQVLDEFWAQPNIGRRPYFVAVAERAINEAIAAYPETEESRQQFSALRQVLVQRDLAAVKAFALTAQWLPVLPNRAGDANQAPGSRDQWISELRILPNASAYQVPNGLAHISLKSGEQESRAGVAVQNPLPIKTVKLAVDWLQQALQDSTQSTTAALKFRGHEYVFPFNLQPITGAATTAQFSRSTQTTLMVEDRQPQSRAITFILDCSASMYEEVAAEGLVPKLPNQPARVNKLDVAKLALIEMLQRLQDRDEHVSVILYGHRVAEGGAGAGRLAQPRYSAKYPISSSLMAFEDVETVLAMGRFGPRELDAVVARLTQVVPWGQTPLYLAIAQALSAGQPNPLQKNHDIVVISDGKNYQFNPTEDKKPDATQVIEQARRLKAKIHVVGFGVPSHELIESQLQFAELAQQSGGTSSQQIADASILLQRLLTLLDVPQYLVEFDDGTHQSGLANTRTVLPNIRDENTPVRLKYEGQDYVFPISPGDAVVLRSLSDGDLQVRTPVGQRTEVADLLDQRGQESGFRASISQPTVENQHLITRIELHSQDGFVPRRPRTVVIEITPFDNI